MISFNLRCAEDHVFEAWFKDSRTYDRQAKQGKITCPVCGNTKVQKAPMAPNIARGVSRDATRNSAMAAAEMRQVLSRLRAEIEKNCDYVGDSFAEEVRKIHYEEVERRNIYGEATEEEAQALEEEGVEFSRIPWIQHTDN